MTKFLRLTTLACALVASFAAHASSYTFRYTFENSGEVSGSFDGTANGDLITGITDITLNVDGMPVAVGGNLEQFSSELVNQSLVPGGAVVSFSGTANRFVISNLGSSGMPSDGEVFFMMGTNTSGVNIAALMVQGGAYYYDAAAYSPARWSVTAVPEPTTYGMLLGGLGVVGAVARRRRSRAQVQA